MKKINILLPLFALALLVISCETYDDYESPRKTVVGFTDPSKNINNVPEGGTKSTTVNIFISDVSTSDRNFTIITVPVDSLATAPDNYTFSNSVTILANERSVDFEVTAVDNSITDDRTFFKLAIQGDADVVSGGRVEIGVRN